MEEVVKESSKEEKVSPLEVKIVNPSENKKEDYEPDDDNEYDDLRITKEQVEEFEKDDSTSSK